MQTMRWPRGSAWLGLACYLLALPPFDLWPLAFFAPIAWLVCIVRPQPISRRGYTLFWITGVIFWLWIMHGTRLSHPALYPGWITLALYLGVYFPLFIGLTRIAHWQWRWPVSVAAPIVWVGLELIRAYAFTGLSAAMLGHALVPWTTVYQVVDLFGTYTASALVIVVGVGIYRGIELLYLRKHTSANAANTVTNDTVEPTVVAHSIRSAKIDLVLSVMLIVSAVGYGTWRVQQDPELGPEFRTEETATKKPLRVALLQADAPAIFEPSLERDVAAFYKYVELSRQAGSEAASRGGVDLVVWPESMFGAGKARYVLSPDGFNVPEGADMTREEFQRAIEAEVSEFDFRAGAVQQEIARSGKLAESPWLMVGASQVEYNRAEHKIYSVAFLYDNKGRLSDWYGKRHLVMFGEYIPFGHWFPWLYKVLPLSYGVTPGPKLLTSEIKGTRIAPSICFETMVEHVANHQVRELQRQGTPPAILINITNDGWFHGSSILDHHLRCSQAIAASHHIPVLIAANSGLTAWVDGSGRVRKVLPRQTEGILFAEPRPDGRFSLYAIVGDWPATVCALLCGAFAWIGWRSRKSDLS